MITTKALIQIFVRDADVRKQILDSFDTMSLDKKGYIVSTVWHQFNDTYKYYLQKNIDEGLDKLAKKEDEPKDFYKKMVEKTDKEIETIFSQKTDEANLDEARRAMEVIIKQMQMAKADRKTKKTVN